MPGSVLSTSEGMTWQEEFVVGHQPDVSRWLHGRTSSERLQHGGHCAMEKEDPALHLGHPQSASEKIALTVGFTLLLEV